MIKSLLLLAAVGLSYIAVAQNASVENSTFGIQTGFAGIWVHNESKLNHQFVIRAEIGVDLIYYGSDYLGIPETSMSLEFTLEPKWYYDLHKRLLKSKNISGNGGNFISIKTSYNPNWFISRDISANDIQVLSFVPTWGIRRNIGKCFTYEAGIGYGYSHVFDKSENPVKHGNENALNLHLRIGYRF